MTLSAESTETRRTEMEMPGLDFSANETRALYEYPDGVEAHAAVARKAWDCRERQLKHYMATARLILRAQLTQHFGRNPTDREMDKHWRMWLDAGKRSVEIREESACVDG